MADECTKWFDRINMLREKKGVFSVVTLRSLTPEEVPIYAGNFIVASYGTGAVMAVPGHDRDFDFTKKYDIPIRQVLSKRKERIRR